MRTLIVYASKHGTTERIVEELKKGLKGDVESFNLRKKPFHKLEGYDKVIIGGSIYAGSLNRKLRKFIKNHERELKNKKVALFLVCLHTGDELKKQYEKNFPKYLRDNIIAKGFFGGEIHFSRLGPAEKVIIWTVEKTKRDIKKVNEKEIKSFIRKVNKK